jgi:hypothetical protein
MKQTKAHETRLKQPQNGVRLNSKPTLRNKGNRTKEKHRKGGHLQRKNNLVSLGNKVGKKVNTFDMPQEVAQNVKAKIMRRRGISNWQGTQRGSHTFFFFK